MKSRDEIHRALVRATETTFADMAFIDAVETPGEKEELSAGQIVHIGFRSPIEGQITLYLSSSLKKLMVENIYGEKWEEVGAGEFDDCLLEILNVLAGNFLKELGSTGEQHGISLPQLHFDDSEIKQYSQFADFYFDAETNPFQVSVSYCETGGY